MSRARGWCFTLNNYSDEEFCALKNFGHSNTVKFIIGKEVGSEGTPHLQGYYYFKNPREFKSVKSLNERLHIEKAKGNPQQNFKYCSKEGNYVSNFDQGSTFKSFLSKFCDTCMRNKHKTLRDEFNAHVYLCKLQKDRGQDYKYEFVQLYDEKYDYIKNCENCINYLEEWETI